LSFLEWSNRGKDERRHSSEGERKKCFSPSFSETEFRKRRAKQRTRVKRMDVKIAFSTDDRLNLSEETLVVVDRAVVVIIVVIELGVQSLDLLKGFFRNQFWDFHYIARTKGFH
jgi:hypothetical protein